MLGKLTGLAVGLTMSSMAMAVDFMDTEWAAQICEAWNESKDLTEGLYKVDSGNDSYSWIKNDAGRGYKLIQIYRSKCGEDSRIQLNIVMEEDKAICAYGGEPDGKEMDSSVDYVMYAKDKHWTCMGSGKCGVMGSMMKRRLRFKGPKMEAMQVMSPFGSFLRLTGEVPGEKGECKAEG